MLTNLSNVGLQEQFDTIEGTSEQDGLRISHPKTELTVFPTRGSGQQLDNPRCGEIYESHRGWTKYLGFYVEACGY